MRHQQTLSIIVLCHRKHPRAPGGPYPAPRLSPSPTLGAAGTARLGLRSWAEEQLAMKQGGADGRVELRFGRSSHVSQNLRHVSVQGAGGSPHRDLLHEHLANLWQHLPQLGGILAFTDDRRRVQLRYGMAGTASGRWCEVPRCTVYCGIPASRRGLLSRAAARGWRSPS